jgi:hypothetical protein
MSPKKNSSEKQPVTVDASKFTKGAKEIKGVTDKWFGVAPSAIQEGLSSLDLPQLSKKAGTYPYDKELTVIGFTKRTGTIKDKETEYLIIMAVPAGESQPVCFITGAAVVVEKLLKAAEENSLPVKGRIVEVEGANATYDDFVS